MYKQVSSKSTTPVFTKFVVAMCIDQEKVRLRISHADSEVLIIDSSIHEILGTMVAAILEIVKSQ